MPNPNFFQRAGVFAIVVLLILCLALPVVAGDNQPIKLDCTPQKFPELVIRGDDISRYPNGKPSAFRGFADPCIRRDPVSGNLWMAYSWPHMEKLSGGLFDYALGVETHLARSRDGGKTWTREKVLWPRTPATFTPGGKGNPQEGFLSHEVPNILPCMIDGKLAWVGVRADYFLARKGNYKARDNRSFCFRLMVAPSPGELSNAGYITFGHSFSTPDCRVDQNFCTFSTDFPPMFIPNEPGFFFQDGRLFLVFVCMTFTGPTPDFPSSFIAVFSTEPRCDINTWKWQYHGKLATHREAKELAGDSLTQIELARGRDGKLLAFLTPEVWNASLGAKSGTDPFFGIIHRSCTIVEVASLTPPALARKPDGSLAVRAQLVSTTQAEQGPGATGYDPADAGGVLFTFREIGSRNLGWSLHPTGVHP